MSDRYEALVSRFGVTVSLYRDDDWVKDVLNFPLPGDGKPSALIKVSSALWERHWTMWGDWRVRIGEGGVLLTADVKYRGLIPDDYK